MRLFRIPLGRKARRAKQAAKRQKGGPKGMNTGDRIVCVVGPTASGKTRLAVELAKRLDGEVVSCDSMQL